jgi:hypothetical protein
MHYFYVRSVPVSYRVLVEDEDVIDGTAMTSINLTKWMSVAGAAAIAMTAIGVTLDSASAVTATNEFIPTSAISQTQKAQQAPMADYDLMMQESRNQVPLAGGDLV